MAKEVSKGDNIVQKAGSVLFIVGVLLAVVFGFLRPTDLGTILTTVIILAGLIVGFLNVTTHETNSFLLASVALVIVSAFGGNVMGNVANIGERLAGILFAILMFVVPATIVVALKTIYALAEK